MSDQGPYPNAERDLAGYRGRGGVPTPASVFPRATPPIPIKPVPDGRLIIRTIHGQEHTYEYSSMPKGWRPTGSGIQVSTPTGRITWIWRQIMNYEIIQNSDEFVKLHRRWFALTHPQEEECAGADSDSD